MAVAVAALPATAATAAAAAVPAVDAYFSSCCWRHYCFCDMRRTEKGDFLFNYILFFTLKNCVQCCSCNCCCCYFFHGFRFVLFGGLCFFVATAVALCFIVLFGKGEHDAMSN